ncbi:MAG: hypothetical protein K9J79_11180, partial [Desulfobacteraceae bacterium]|nr:hypothetical protein [Desulfobacteraceae bacterium]
MKNQASGIHIGTSGWNYKHWKGAFYPEDLRPKHWFGYYAERFHKVHGKRAGPRRETGSGAVPAAAALEVQPGSPGILKRCQAAAYAGN